MRLRLLALMLSTACYSPGYKDCEITCATQACPSGYSCNAGGFCVTDPQMSCSGIGSDGGGGSDSGDSGTTNLGPWGMPSVVRFASGTPAGDDHPTLTDDMKMIYVRRLVAGQSEIFAATRQTVMDIFITPAIVSSIDTSANNELTPELSGDGLTLYFASDRNSPAMGTDIFVANRSSLTANWGQPTPVTAVNSTTSEDSSAVSRDALSMVFSSSRSGATDLYLSNRMTVAEAFGTPMNMAALNDPNRRDDSPFLSADKLTIYFSSDRPGGTGQFDLWQAKRPDVTSPFGMPTPITELNTASNETDPWVSPDGKHIFYTGTVGGALTIMEATR